MFNDFTIFLWVLKIGSLINLYFLTNTYMFPAMTVDLYIVVPARILFAVSAYRCLFPVQYKNNVVFHNSPFSSIFLTRLFATFSEISYIYLLSHVIRLLNINHVEWVNFLSWLMVLQVAISQCFVWGAILTGQLVLYYYEELGWAIIFAINTIASAYLYLTIGTLAGTEILIRLNLLFGIVYLPWQFIHLRVLHVDARQSRGTIEKETKVTWSLLKEGLLRCIYEKNQTSDANAWGGLVGLIWMTGYWVTLIPLWVNQIVITFSW